MRAASVAASLAASAAALSLAAGALAAPSGVGLVADSPWILVLANESTGVRMAARDVQKDSYRALGAPPVVLDSFPGAKSMPPNMSVLVAGSPAGNPAVASMVAAGLIPANCTTTWEAHCLVVLPAAESPLGVDTIVATGEGKRGPIFALYELADRAFGALPLWRYADAPATFLGDDASARISSTVMVQSPAFRFRAGFPNDEDLTAYWSPSPMGEDAWSLEAFDRYYETMLRMKANALLVGTNPFPDERAVRLASRRGLTVMHHHYNLLGSQVTRWPLGTGGWNFETDPQAMAHVWRASVAAQSDLDVIWSVGLRGLNDYAYPCPDAASCSRQINDAMGNMSAWVRAAQGEDARIVLYMWDELLQYLQAGLLRVPPGVRVIFGDEGAGMVHGSSLLGEYADGLYDHSAMYNYNANQLTEMIPVDRIITQVVRTFMAAAKSLFVFVLNTSDLRPAPMTSLAYFRAAWAPASVDTGGDPTASASAFYSWFAQRYYGLAAGGGADKAAAAWAAWFAAPLIHGGRSDNWIADEAIGPLADALATASRAGAPLTAKARDMINATLTGCDPASVTAFATAYGDVVALADAVPPARRSFFAAHAVANMAHGHFGCRAGVAVAEAARAYEEADLQAARAFAAAGADEIASLMAARRAAETGQWSAWYFGDHLTDFHAARRSVLNAAAGLSVARSAGPANTGPIWYAFDDYQKAFAANYPLLYPSDDWNLARFVRVHCVSPNVSSGACANRPDGGRWRPGMGARVEMLFGPPGGAPPTPGLVLRYTLDGSRPGPDSPEYGGPLDPDTLGNSTGTVHLMAAAQVNGTMLPIVAESVWKAW